MLLVRVIAALSAENSWLASDEIRGQSSIVRTPLSTAEEGRSVVRSRAGSLTRKPLPTLCLVTRIEVRNAWDVGVLILSFGRLRRQAREVTGLVEAFMIRRRPAVYIVSLWSDERAIADFATAVPGHLKMVRWTHGRKLRSWSALYDFVGTSPPSAPWEVETSPVEVAV